jgi:Undecaprenyl-phosphate galactose phosphotransferase WbaP
MLSPVGLLRFPNWRPPVNMSLLHPNSIARVAELNQVPASRSESVARSSAHPWLCTAVLLLGDLAAVAFGAVVSILIWPHFSVGLSSELYLRLWPVLMLFPLAYAAFGLYPSFGRNPAEELRRLTVATCMVYPALAVTVFLLKDAPTYSRGVFVMVWVQTLIFVPLLRSVVRSTCALKSWWGYPVVVVGAPDVAAVLAVSLALQPELGLKPVAVFDNPELAAPLAQDGGIRHVIFALAGVSQGAARESFDRCSELFPNIIVIPEIGGLSSLWVEARDLNGVLGLGVQQRLLMPGPRVIKRALDLALVAVLGTLGLPVIAFIALAIKITSSGPVFYGQTRRGRGGRPFVAWKFRSMYANASELLDQCLASDPNLREEWRQCQKLRRDPRITPLGRLLRRTSLDELPQLWNIVLGQMSFIGPRPIISEEISRYGDGFALYAKVAPGLSGMWQVSGRNNLSYEQRVTLDLYYVRNWSVWLDLHILARTIRVVVFGDGAY